MSIFRTVAKQCQTPGCRELQKRVGRHEGFCKECQQPLGEIRGPDWRWIGIIGLALVVLGLLSVWLPFQLKAALARREARQKVVSTPAEPVPISPPKRSPAGEGPGLSPEETSRRSLQSGHTLAAKGQYAAARKAYRDAVASDPKNATAWADLGLAAALTGHSEEALDCYTKALELEPHHWLAHYNLGLFLGRRGDREQALFHLQQAFAATPDRQRRGALERDLRATSLPAQLRNDHRFAALLEGETP